MKDSPEKIIYTYDSRNRLSSVRYENGTLITYSYDPVGNLTGCRVIPQDEQAATDSFQPQSVHRDQILIPPSVCPGCGMMVNPDKKFCSNCGAPVNIRSQTVPATPLAPALSAACPFCGNPNRPGAKFCGKCGKKLA